MSAVWVSGLLELENVSKSFDGAPVLKGISYHFGHGSMTAISGPSGSGKTTLLRIILGLIEPDRGRVIRADGLKLAAVFQEDRLIEGRGARDNLRMVCPKSVQDSMLDGALEELGIDEDVGDAVKPVSMFSGGMRRRVALARAMVVHADLIVLDEPFKGLDEKARAEAIDFVKRWRGGAAVILVTHEREEIQMMGIKQELSLLRSRHMV